MLPAWRAGDLPRPEESHIYSVSPGLSQKRMSGLNSPHAAPETLAPSCVAGGVGTRVIYINTGVSWHFLLLSFFFFL